MSITSKEIRKSYFLIYDDLDNCIMYIDNYNELSKYTKEPIFKITQLFNKSDYNYINIFIYGKRFRLYKFIDD